MNDTIGYARYELLRTFRNKRLYIFSFAFPLVLYHAIAGPNRHEHDSAGRESARRCTSWSDSQLSAA